MVISLVVGLVLTYVIWSLVDLEINVYRASSMRIPLVRLPIDQNNVVWIIVEPYVWAVVDSLPIQWSSWPSFVRYARRGWHFRDKAQGHLRMGPLYAIVTPMSITVQVGDAEAAHQVFSRRLQFIRPTEQYSTLGS
jgi:hypothetical protein